MAEQIVAEIQWISRKPGQKFHHQIHSDARNYRVDSNHRWRRLVSAFDIADGSAHLATSGARRATLVMSEEQFNSVVAINSLQQFQLGVDAGDIAHVSPGLPGPARR